MYCRTLIALNMEEETLRFPGSKTPLMKELLGHSPSVHHGLETKPGSYGSIVALSRQNKATGYDPAAALRIREHMIDDDDADETMYEVVELRDRDKGTYLGNGVTRAVRNVNEKNI